jgi:carboxyl-terminal processing protease
MVGRKLGFGAAKLIGVIALFVLQAWPQQPMSGFDRDRAQTILKVIAGDIRKNYYDPKLHGLDWDAAVADAKQRIQRATTFNAAMSEIAAAIDLLNDSHTFLLPPQHAYRLDYGLQYQMVGDRCLITQVRPKSDADNKGVKTGEEILTIDGYNATRDSLWKIQYFFSVLRPQPGFRLRLRDLARGERQVDVAAKIHQTKGVLDLTGGQGGNDIWDLFREQENQEHLMRARYQDYGEPLMVLKVPEFFFSRLDVENMIGRGRKHPNLIIDLRGNPGGSIDTLKDLLGGVFDKDVKIADRVRRKDTKPEIAKPLRNPFMGKLIVLVDARSASASELFARIVQIEKRGIVVGDRTSGSVMESLHYNEKMGEDRVIFYGASITEADLIMTDGKSLEHAGVVPDEVILPSAQDLASGRDPALARAAELLGVKLSPEEAGEAFPFEWPPL